MVGSAGGPWTRAAIVGAVMLLGAGCEDNSTTGPKTVGLTVESLDLTPSGSGGCKVKVTLVNHTGSDLSGQIAYQLLNAQKTIIGSTIVFPNVPDGTRRTATSDFLKSSTDGHPLACADVVAIQLLPVGTTIPIAS